MYLLGPITSGSTMMIRAVLILSVCAYAQCAAAESVAPYSHSQELLEKALQTLGGLIYAHNSSESEVPSAKRNYVILMAVVEAVAEKLNVICGPQYEKAYWSVVDEWVPEAWTNPGKVESIVTMKTDSLRHTVWPVVQLVQKYCGKTQSAKCDKAVDLEIQTSPAKYEKGVKTLLAFADLAKIYLANTYEDLAKKNLVITFLLTEGLEELKEVISKLKVVKEIYSPPACKT